MLQKMKLSRKKCCDNFSQHVIPQSHGKALTQYNEEQ